MSEQCEEARKQLRLAEEWLRKLELAYEDAEATRRVASGELDQAGYDYERAVAGAKGHDDRVVEAAAEVEALKRSYADHASGDATNRDAILKGLEEQIRTAEWAHHDAVASSEKAWAQATELAGVQEARRTALTTAANRADVAEGELSGGRSDVAAAEREVASACS